MTYEKQIWENYPSTNSPITADALNHIENGIYNNSMIVQDSLSGSSTSNSPSIRAINEALSGIQLRGGGDTLPIGTIMPYTSDTIPNGWLLCDGRAVSRAEYSELFQIIGTIYGTGDGSTTFNLPNQKGKVAVGKDSTDTDFNTLGKTGGEKTHTLTINEMPSHNHHINIIGVGQGSYGYNLSSLPIGSEQNEFTDNKGGGQSHNILQPYIVLNFIIKAKQEPSTLAIEDSLPLGTIVDYEGNTVPDGYIQVEENNQIVTGQEKPTNMYLDGKQVFVKRFEFDTLGTGTQNSPLDIDKSIGYTLSQINVFKIDGIIKSNSQNIIPIGCGLNSTGVYDAVLTVNNSENSVRLSLYNSNYSDGYAYANLYYTKVHDIVEPSPYLGGGN